MEWKQVTQNVFFSYVCKFYHILPLFQKLVNNYFFENLKSYLSLSIISGSSKPIRAQMASNLPTTWSRSPAIMPHSRFFCCRNSRIFFSLFSNSLNWLYVWVRKNKTFKSSAHYGDGRDEGADWLRVEWHHHSILSSSVLLIFFSVNQKDKKKLGREENNLEIYKNFIYQV